MAIFSSGADQARVSEPELMDDPQLAPAAHERALRGLARLNWLSRSPDILWPPIAALARRLQRDQLRLLDVASGAGDIPLRLWQRARRHRIDLQVQGIDVSPQAIAFARRRAAQHGAPIEYEQLDALRDPVPGGFDVVTCSLFLHHLQPDEVQRLLAKMGQATEHLVLVQDLRRSRSGWWLAYLASRMFSTSHVVHVDALRSVRAAFSAEETRQLALDAGLADATTRPRWPFRYLLSWERV